MSFKPTNLNILERFCVVLDRLLLTYTEGLSTPGFSGQKRCGLAFSLPAGSRVGWTPCVVRGTSE